MSQYGETFNIQNNHQIDIKAKLDSLLSKNTEIELNNDQVEALLTSANSSHSSIDGKIVACNTGACVVASSALPSGASSEAKQDVNNASIASVDAKIIACNTGACVVASSALPSGASSEAKQDVNNASIASVDEKITVCDTANVVVSSSALPSGASSEAKQDVNNAYIASLELSNQAIKSAVEGVLTVTSGSVKSSSTPISSQSINGQSEFTSSEIDINTAKHISVLAESSDTVNSHELDVEVSNTSGGTYYPTSHSAFFLDGKCHILVSNIPYRYIKVKVKNGDSDDGNSADFTAHLIQST
jgi:hypothetical protein